jgi:hypothetical protein
VCVNGNGVQFASDEMLDFTMTMRSNMDAPDLHLRVIIDALGEKPIAVANVEEPIPVKQGETVKHRVRVPLERFNKGRYVVTLSVFTVTAGRPAYYDTVYNAFGFEVTDDQSLAKTGLAVDTARDGAFRLNPIETEMP